MEDLAVQDSGILNACVESSMHWHHTIEKQYFSRADVMLYVFFFFQTDVDKLKQSRLCCSSVGSVL